MVMSFFIFSDFKGFEAQTKVPPIKNGLYGAASGGEE